MDYLVNLFAFLLPLFIFLFWGTIGLATLNVLRTQRNTLQNMLLAPVIGFSVTLLPIFTLNRLGLPAASFSSLLAIVLLGLSLFSLWQRKIILPWKWYLPFAGIFIMALILIGRPLLSFGFDWVSYSNDDMANYTLGALRILKHGFFDIPSVEALRLGQDYSLFYWFMHVPGMVRPGCEMLIAFLSGATHIPCLEIFMPTILAFHLTLLSTTGALLCTTKRKNTVALVACLLLSFSALTVLGTLYQLIAQVAGLSVLMACLVLIFQPFTAHKKYYSLRQGILIAIIVSSLIIIYPELTPFLGLAFILYFTLMLIKGWRPKRSFWLSFFFAMIFAIILLNTHLIAALQFLFVQINVGSSTALREIHAAIFPYYLLPSGLANLWGLQTMSIYPQEPRMSLTILLGTLLTLTTIYLTCRLFFLRTSHFASVIIIMLAVATNLFIHGLGFGIFKLAMFLQPFFACVIAVSLFELVKDNYKKSLVVLCLILGGVSSLNYYVTRSKAITPGGFSEVLFASNTKLNKEFRQGIAKAPPGTIFLSDDFNVSVVKFLAFQAQDKNFLALVSPLFFVGYLLAQDELQKTLLEDLSNKYFLREESSRITRIFLGGQYHMAHFILPDRKNATIDFLQYNADINAKNYNERSILVSDGSLRTILNRRHTYHLPARNFNFIPYHEIKNHLVFIDARQGGAYNSLLQAKDPTTVSSFFNLEGDWTYPDKTLQAMGRYLLFRILNPSDKVRMVMNISNTLDHNADNSLPRATVIGNEVLPFALVGRGSARVFSAPITPQWVEQIPYIAIDMQKDGRIHPYSRYGLMQLYGSKIALDLRKVVTFGRDISLITETEYQNIRAPAEIKHFPADLANPDLAYSGFYEDGWISEEAYVQLSQPHPHYQLVIKGELPKIDANFVAATVTLLIDEKTVLQQTLKPDYFELKYKVEANDQPSRKIMLRFSHLQHLSGGDKRPIAAKIKYIGFKAD